MLKCDCNSDDDRNPSCPVGVAVGNHAVGVEISDVTPIQGEFEEVEELREIELRFAHQVGEKPTAIVRFNDHVFDLAPATGIRSEGADALLRALSRILPDVISGAAASVSGDEEYVLCASPGCGEEAAHCPADFCEYHCTQHCQGD